MEPMLMMLPPLPPQVRECGLGEKHGSPEVDRDHRVPLGNGYL
jgi:hypothetical protein